MLMMFIFILAAFILASILTSLALFTGKKSQNVREKMSPYECGFSPVKKARSPFSLTFFLITLIFLIFDVEIAILLPLGEISPLNSWLFTSTLGVFFTFILLAGLLHEWNQGMLNWSK